MPDFHPVGVRKVPPSTLASPPPQKKGREGEREREREGEGRGRGKLFTPLVAVVKSIRNATHTKCYSHFHPKPKILDETPILLSGICRLW